MAATCQRCHTELVEAKCPRGCGYVVRHCPNPTCTGTICAGAHNHRAEVAASLVLEHSTTCVMLPERAA